MTNSVQCYLDGARGQYIPRDFARGTKRDCIEGVKAEDLDYLALGPGGCLDDSQELVGDETVRGEYYLDVWETVLDNAILTDPETKIRFRLHQDDSLFLVPEDWEWHEGTESFRPPESETLMRFELPAYWASYLINGDGSGLEPGEQETIDAFLAKEKLADWTCADCSAESFAHSNDATSFGGDVCEYTFIKH